MERKFKSDGQQFHQYQQNEQSPDGQPFHQYQQNEQSPLVSIIEHKKK
jgi:hypothetical protein